MSQVRLNISFSIQNLEEEVEEEKKTLTANELSGICQCVL